jgi:DNA-binding transcriptional LysR family regulator
MIMRYLESLPERAISDQRAACKVTQSTLSAGIQQLEEVLGVLIVERGKRFVGLTPSGS